MAIVSQAVSEKLSRASWIRKMFEEGARLKAERGAENVFDFTLGNPEVEPPAAVRETLSRLVASDERGMHSYMPNAGFPATRKSIADRLSKASGLEFSANNVIMTVGAGGGLNTVLKAILDPGDEVIVLAPFFVEYVFYIGNHGGEMVLVDTDDAFQLDLAAIEKAITPRTKAILINTPNNPTGAIYDEASLKALGELLASQPQQILAISDEPYKALTFDGYVAPELPACIENSIVVTSWSKALAIPGERIGYIAISPRVDGADALAGACTFTNRTLGFVNAPAIWQRVVAETGHLAVDIGPYQEKRDLFLSGLREIGYDVVTPRGSFYLFPKTPIPDDVEFAGLAQKEGVLVVPGSGFGRPGHMRVTLTVPRDTIERSMPGFKAAFENAQ